LHDIAGVNAAADVNLLRWFFLDIVDTKLGLNLLCALDGMDHGGKVHQKGIPNRLDDGTLMCDEVSCLDSSPATHKAGD
jgi:hypothetical protein